MRSTLWILVLVFWLGTVVTVVVASSGDRAWDFSQCVEHCAASREEYSLSLGAKDSATSSAFAFSATSAVTWPLNRAISSTEESDGVAACASTLPRSLRLTRWTCRDDCQYICMHGKSAADAQQIRSHQQPVVHQYYGKWPFVRVLGCQEPLATLFSIGNLVQHARGLRYFLRRTAPWISTSQTRHHGRSYQQPLAAAFPMAGWFTARRWAILYGVASIHLWVWSAVFHTRDTWVTERGDYLGVAFATLCSWQWSVSRWWLHSRQNYDSRITMRRGGRPKGWVPWISAVVLAAMFARHAYWLLAFDRFDYGYNMAWNVAVGGLHNAAWLAWAVRELARGWWARRAVLKSHHQVVAWPVRVVGWAVGFGDGSDDDRKKVAMMVLRDAPDRARRARLSLIMTVGLTASMALELLDFAPIGGYLDAHALWHASTIPLIPVWWQFIADDAAAWADVEADQWRQK
ncbi:Per1-like-domain-containing protein [Blastocladiella britannica]|nr:Per1-like-domain-containing protein [Blastocladiella britannica]